MLVVQQGAMGRNSARDAVEAAFDEFDFGFVICLGIAGSLSEGLHLCDVCYSEHVYDFYDNTKAQETKDGELEIRFSPNHARCYPPVVVAMNFIRTVPELQDLHAEWQLQREVLANGMFPSAVVGRTARWKPRRTRTQMGYSRYDAAAQGRAAWNAGKMVGTKPPLTQKQINNVAA
jgi:hypothetical protein